MISQRKIFIRMPTQLFHDLDYLTKKMKKKTKSEAVRSLIQKALKE